MKACRCARPRSTRPKLEAGGWLASGTLLLLVPKCPACLAGYVAAFTGLGLSLPAAAGLRWGIIALLAALLGILTLRLIRKHASSTDP